MECRKWNENEMLNAGERNQVQFHNQFSFIIQGTAVRWSATNKVQSCLWQFIIIKSFRKSNTCSSSWSQACFKQRWVNCLLHWNWASCWLASNWLKLCHWFWGATNNIGWSGATDSDSDSEVPFSWYFLRKIMTHSVLFPHHLSFFLIATSPLYLSMTSQGLGL